MRPKILIVDDEAHMLRLTEMSLRKTGFDLLLARSGREAVDLAVREKPQLIVMDVIMPGFDGLAALEEIKLRPETAHIPVILLSARSHILTREEAERCGAALFLTKPFSPTELLTEARRLVERTPPPAS
jgi:CheY-like chemotaxis protein